MYSIIFLKIHPVLSPCLLVISGCRLVRSPLKQCWFSTKYLWVYLTVQVKINQQGTTFIRGNKNDKTTNRKTEQKQIIIKGVSKLLCQAVVNMFLGS
jgi:hypothetical protein